MAKARPLCLGVITGARGVRGEVRIRTFTERPEDIACHGPLTDETGERSFALSDAKSMKGGVAARVEGVGDRSDAEALKGTHLYVGREMLPDLDEEEFYHADLIGLQAKSTDGGIIGTVAAVYNFGAGDILEIKRSGEPTLIVPFTREIVPEVDIEQNLLVLVPPLEVSASGNDGAD